MSVMNQLFDPGTTAEMLEAVTAEQMAVAQCACHFSTFWAS